VNAAAVLARPDNLASGAEAATDEVHPGAAWRDHSGFDQGTRGRHVAELHRISVLLPTESRRDKHVSSKRCARLGLSS
jgi:hypothetical protein